MDQTQAVEPRVIEAKPRPEVNEPLLRWQAPEFLFFEKDRKWFLLAALAGVGVLGVALFFRQWIAALLVLATGAVVYQHAGRAPREMEYVITKLGVQVGEKLYPYNQLKSFWLIYEPPVRTLNLQMTRRLAPQVVIQLGDTDPVSVKSVLSKHIPEEPRRGEDWIDRLARLVRF
jgi:hypothetical protein